jgi:hypothetical protein
MPGYKRLKHEPLRGRLLNIRQAVEPILASNVLRSFTDHSVSHSDQVCDLIDELTAVPSSRPLNNIEAFVVYAAAYLHDVGMQHEKCDETQAMARALASSPYRNRRWADLEERTRWHLLRCHHHEISREMVRSSVDAAQPTVLGIQLTHQDHPGFIGALCEAHCVTPDTDEYRKLTAEGPGIRTALLSALLRLADILDESQRRTHLYRERTVQLDVESQMHWWRHYYVAQVDFRADDKSIVIWFDYPPDRREEYRSLVPELQVPWIESELRSHQGVMLANDVAWRLTTVEVNALHSTAVPMPEAVQLRMLAEVQRLRRERAAADRLTALRQLEGAQGLVARRLEAIRASGAGALDQLIQSRDLADQLRGLGGSHDASRIFDRAFETARKSLDLHELVDESCRLGEMLLLDGEERRAGQVLSVVRTAVDALAPNDQRRCRFMIIWCRVLLANVDVTQAVQVLAELQRRGLRVMLYVPLKQRSKRRSFFLALRSLGLRRSEVLLEHTCPSAESPPAASNASRPRYEEWSGALARGIPRRDGGHSSAGKGSFGLPASRDPSPGRSS